MTVSQSPEARTDETEGDFWRDVSPELKQISQEKRAGNRESSAELLRASGFTFTTNNGGVHLIVQARDHVVDFWPGTGRWQTRGWRFTVQGRGVRRLIEHLKDSP